MSHRHRRVWENTGGKEDPETGVPGADFVFCSPLKPRCTQAVFVKRMAKSPSTYSVPDTKLDASQKFSHKQLFPVGALNSPILQIGKPQFRLRK